MFRTAGDLTDKRGDLGYMFRAELRKGETRTVTVGFRAFDVVAPVEAWTLRNAVVYRELVPVRFDRLPTEYPYTLMVPQNITEQVLLDRLEELGGRAM